MSDPKSELESRLAWLGALAGGLAHEIKNPLSTMSINLSLLHEDWQRAESQREKRTLRKIEVLQREVKRLERIVEDFLAYARGVDLDLKETDLRAFLDDLLEFCDPELRAASVVVHTSYARDLPPVNIDRHRMRQALLNLLVNARQAMEGGGELVVKAQRRGEEVEVEVIDNGCGMTPETRERCFQAYFSTKKGGSGLGLPTVKRIVEEHGGVIEVQSEPSRGTCFRVRLPRSEPPSAGPDGVGSEHAGRAGFAPGDASSPPPAPSGG